MLARLIVFFSIVTTLLGCSDATKTSSRDDWSKGETAAKGEGLELVGPQTAANEVWFAPNMGSPDMLNLFTQPELWAAARSKINVFQFYGVNIFTDTPEQCAICNGNQYARLLAVDAFRKLKAWGIDIAIEIGVLRSEHPEVPLINAVNETISTIDRVVAVGGEVSRIEIDSLLFALKPN